jgi:SAM-dependent methyltransferase
MAVQLNLPNNPYLYFGNLGESEPQFKVPNFVGLALKPRHDREIVHNVLSRLPFADGLITKVQAQDVFEHLPKESVVGVFDDVYRVLAPGGVFRLSVPDYRSPLLKGRSIYNSRGEVIADLLMGGTAKYDAKTTKYRAEYGTDGNAHLWFPTYQELLDLVIKSKIRFCQNIIFYHYFIDDVNAVILPFPENEMPIWRAPPKDMRANGNPISIIVDFIK